MESNLALFRAAVLARKEALRYQGTSEGFRPVIEAYWRARRAYANAARVGMAEAHKLITIAATAA